MQDLDIGQIIDLNEDIESLKAKLETVKAELSIEEAMRESFSKDLTPKILHRRVRHKMVNGKRQAFTEVVIDETELKNLVEMASCRARVEENIEKLKKLGAQLKRELNQTEIYKNSRQLEAEIKQIKTDKLLLEAQIKDLNREIVNIQSQGSEPFIDYEEQTFDLEIE